MSFTVQGGRQHGLRSQAEHAREDIVLRLLHLVLPWAAWLSLLPLALLLRLAFPGRWTVVATAAAGCVLAALDFRLRSHRGSVLGRWIGPVTVLSVTGWLTLIVDAGWSKAALEAFLFGGLVFCLGWDIWMAHGDHRDLQRAFIPAAETAFKVPGARMSGLRHDRHSSSAKMQLPRGERSLKEAADRLEHLEGALGHPPGSWTLTSDADDSGLADVKLTDPRFLDRAPFPWPGPSAPGESVSVPFREGIWADGEPVLYDVIPVRHARAMGATGSGKTMSWAWCHIGEGITRINYGCLAMDPVKGDQFLGPLRPALHGLAIEPGEVLEMLAALHRARRARCDYLAKNHLTEWREGCGLTYLEGWMEEAAEIVGLMDPSKTKRDPGVFYLRDWVGDVRASRTAGIGWKQSYHRVDHTQAPPVARGQMEHLCFGVLESKDAEFGLSERQQERGCRPQLWGINVPGKAFWDSKSFPEERKTLPLRFFSWGEDSHQIASYASEWPASERPFDDVTGEALEARRPRSPTSSLVLTGSRAGSGVSNGNGASNGHANGNGNGHANGNGQRPVAVDRRPAPRNSRVIPSAPPGPHRRARIKPEEAIARVRAQLAAWRAEGLEFTARQLMEAVGEDVVCPASPCVNPGCTGLSRTWLYKYVKELVTAETLAEAGGSPIRYRVVGELTGEQA